MFTLKFYKFMPEGDKATSISCPHYAVYRRKDSPIVTVTVYKDQLATEGVERHISDDPAPDSAGHYSVCYVENMAGKTIDKITQK
jgi:hypothetical protein